MGGLKSESAKFKSSKSVKELTQLLRSAQGELQAQIDRIEDDDPLAGDDEKAALAVLFEGNVGRFEEIKYGRGGASFDLWAVQVFIYELGVERVIELVALGEQGLMVPPGAYILKASVNRMNRLIEILH